LTWEPDRGRRRWRNQPEEQAAVYANRRRIRSERGKALLRRRENILKRFLVHYAALNLGLLLRLKFGHGTPRGVASPSDTYLAAQMALLCGHLMRATDRSLQLLTLVDDSLPSCDAY